MKPHPAQRLLLTAGGLGLLRPAPGTWGSLPPVVIALLLAQEASSLSAAHPNWIVNGVLLALAVVASVICIGLGRDAEQIFNCKDPSPVVADEVAGQAMTLLVLPWRYAGEAHQLSWNVSIALTGFILFRIMDITKPPPARGLQRLPAGWGILVDDLIAAAYAIILIQLCTRLLLPALTGP